MPLLLVQFVEVSPLGIVAALRATSPGRGWTGSYVKDADSGVKAKNHEVVGPGQGG